MSSTPVAIVGVGYSRLERRSRRPLGLLAKDACLAAVGDAGLLPQDIDGFATYPEMPLYGGGRGSTENIDVVPVSAMVALLHAEKRVTWYAESAMGLVTSSVIQAIHALQAGACTYALVWRAVHMPTSGRYMDAASSSAAGANQFTTPFGLAGAAWQQSLMFSRYFHKYGGSRELLAPLPVHSRMMAQSNPDAYFYGAPMTAEDYLTARMIADPLSLLDCDVPIDGCAAMVLAAQPRAIDRPHRPAYVTAVAQLVMPGPNASGDLELWEEGMAHMGQLLWQRAGLRPTDVSAAMLYDGFSIYPLLWLAALGFCAPGDAFSFIQGGRIAVDGELPLNTSGGSLSQGRLHGAGHIIEAALQVSGRALGRQVQDTCDVVVTTGTGTMSGGLTLSVHPRDNRPCMLEPS